MKSQYEIKSAILGPNCDLTILNRKIRWTTSGLEYEADDRHAQIVIESLGLSHAKPCVTPAVKPAEPAQKNKQNKDDMNNPNFHEDNENNSNFDEARRYKSLAARLNYLATDRVDIQFAVCAIARGMANPSLEDWTRLKRLGRYLKYRPKLVNHFGFQEHYTQLRVQTDSDWAGDRETRKSTSGCTIRIGGHLIKSFSKMQPVIAKSSGEAELYAANKGATEAIGIQSVARDLNIKLSIGIEIDSKAAQGTCSKRGLGTAKHIAIADLWLQDAQRRGQLRIDRVPTDRNTADLGTKELDSATIDKHVAELNGEWRRTSCTER
jgi:hypothetical protein